jgi:hypothetical protein
MPVSLHQFAENAHIMGLRTLYGSSGWLPTIFCLLYSVQMNPEIGIWREAQIFFAIIDKTTDLVNILIKYFK